jgi:CYTH domain-containing protein
MTPYLEIEKKFLIRHPPAGWKRRASTRIDQGYFPVAGKDLEIRLRRKGAEHFITFKSGRAGCRTEEEVPISARVFRSLWPLTGTARIAKRRYKIPCDGRTIEMDVYQGPHRGLMTAEVEFDSRRASQAFRPPDWLGREVTNKQQYTNAMLARHGRAPRSRSRG